MSDLDDFFAKKDKKKKSKNKDIPSEKKVKKKEKIIENITNEDEEKPITEIDEHPVHVSWYFRSNSQCTSFFQKEAF